MLLPGTPLSALGRLTSTRSGMTVHLLEELVVDDPTDDSTSQYGFAAVVAGVPHLAPRQQHYGVGDALRGSPW